jgi:hypothetical protein
MPQPALLDRPHLLHSPEARERREFDILASIYQMRADLRLYGQVRPEILGRVYDEELTYIAESIDAPLVTGFEQSFLDDSLCSPDGTPMLQMLHNGLEAARKAALQDPRLGFHVRRAELDYAECEVLEAMMRGPSDHNTVISFQTFPEEALQRYGTALVGSKGYNHKRRLSFIRIRRLSDAETYRYRGSGIVAGKSRPVV